MRIFTGQVISKKMPKTATVAVERVIFHSVYKKRYKRTKKYHVHDGVGSQVGQKVRFVASKPYSKLKRWKIIGLVDQKPEKGVKTRKKSK